LEGDHDQSGFLKHIGSASTSEHLPRS